VLRAEVEKLKQLNSSSVGADVISKSHREVAWLRQQLMMKEAEMNEMKRSAVIISVLVVVIVDAAHIVCGAGCIKRNLRLSVLSVPLIDIINDCWQVCC